MSFFKPQTTKHIHQAMSRSIQMYEQAEDKEEQCNPNVPLLILLNGKKHYVLSIGGDPKEEGLIVDIKPASYFK